MYTRVPPFKNGHRELLKKICTPIFYPETENRAKKGVSAQFGPVLGYPNCPSKLLKINVSRFKNATHSCFAKNTGPRGCFLITQIPRTPKTTLGANGEAGLSRGGSFLKKKHQHQRKRAKMSRFGRFGHFWAQICTKKPFFCAIFSSRCLKNICIHFFGNLSRPVFECTYLRVQFPHFFICVPSIPKIS